MLTSLKKQPGDKKENRHMKGVNYAFYIIWKKLIMS